MNDYLTDTPWFRPPYGMGDWPVPGFAGPVGWHAQGRDLRIIELTTLLIERLPAAGFSFVPLPEPARTAVPEPPRTQGPNVADGPAA